jgi:hypothetical protein
MREFSLRTEKLIFMFICFWRFLINIEGSFGELFEGNFK